MTPKEKNVFEWVAIGITCCAAPPVGFVLATAKGISLLREHSRQQNRARWNNQYYARDPHMRQNRSYYPYNNSAQQSSAGQYSASPQNPSEYNRAYSRMTLMNKIASPHAGRGLIIGGSSVAGLFGFCALTELFENISDVINGYGLDYDFVSTFGVMLLFAAVGGVMIHCGRKKRFKARQYRKYLTLIGDRNLANLREIARTTGTQYEELCEDITDLLMKGTFGNHAYIDFPSGYLVLNPSGTAALNDAARRQAEAQKSAAEARMRASAPKDPADEILAEIRQVNDEIPDERLSAQIDRIEEITRLILQCQKEHPEKEAQLHSFLSYYLPTTLKILKAYADMEKQSVQGKNITETKARIEGMMDKVVHGFEVQLDQLFASDYMDISSDITVLENMMAQDGLTSGFPGTSPSGQTSAL